MSNKISTLTIFKFPIYSFVAIEVNILKTSIIVLLLLTVLSSSGQEKNDTTYFNKNWKLCLKDSASYYRVSTKDNNKNIQVADYFMNGKCQMTGTLKSLNPEVKEGLFAYYSEDGNITSKANYHNDKLNGIKEDFYKTGTHGLRLLSEYKKGKLHGKIMGYYENGKTKRIEKYRKGKMKKGHCYTITGADTTYYPIIQKPSYFGGQNELFKFLQTNLHYPELDRAKGISGVVYVKFFVEKNGEITNISIEKGIEHGIALEQEAQRVVALMPRWQPGMDDNEKFRFYFILPVRFTLI